MGQLPWVAAMMLGFGVLAYQQLAPEFSSNSFANELADNGWRSFLSAARQNRLDYRQFYASRPDAEVMADLQRLSGQGRSRSAARRCRRWLIRQLIRQVASHLASRMWWW